MFHISLIIKDNPIFVFRFHYSFLQIITIVNNNNVYY